MKTWKRALRDAAVAGGIAGLTSLAAMALRGRSDNGTVWAALNAPSHWVWGRPALREDGPSLRYTAVGLVIHHLSAGFWALLHEKALGDGERRKGAPARLRDAAATTAVAALVDLRGVPQRLTPGFERRLSPPSLAAVYALFAIGLAAGSWFADRRRGR